MSANTNEAAKYICTRQKRPISSFQMDQPTVFIRVQITLDLDHLHNHSLVHLNASFSLHLLDLPCPSFVYLCRNRQEPGYSIVLELEK